MHTEFNKYTLSVKFFVVRYSLFITIFILSLNHSWGQTGNQQYEIRNVNGTIIPSDSKQKIESINTDQQPTPAIFNGKYFRLIQFYDLPSGEQRKDWAKKGLILTDYLSGKAYYAVIDSSFNFSRLSDKIRAIIPVKSMFKEEPKLHTMVLKKSAQVSSGKMKLVVSYYKGLISDDVITNLKSLGVEIEKHRDYSRQLDISIPTTLYNKVAVLPYLQFIGLAPEEPVNEGAYNHRNSSGRTNYVNTGFNGLNYNGEGVVIGVGEGGIADNPVDAKGRFTEMSSDEVSTHKIGVIQNAGGSGTLDPSDQNNAFGANILSLPTIPDYAALFNSDHLLFTNHSYGATEVTGEYDSEARDHDLRTAAYPLHMVIYSAGNSGAGTGLYAPYEGIDNWANITRASKHNKNHLTIGALAPNDELTDFSSRGPMYDGRIIPQLVVEGIEGTSDAAPKVTGMLAVLEQIYKEKNNGQEAPSTLLKAILINTADDIENPGPDYKTGYGIPNVRRAYNVINDAQYITGSVDNGNTNTHTINVPANTAQLRVTIVWPDVAATIGAEKAIVNDLDLLGTSPSSIDYNPWILDATPNIVNIAANAIRGVDTLNTIEQITVDTPTSGNWNFTVTGTSVPDGPQTYFLIYEFLQEELKMAFPLENEHFESGQTYYLRWDSYGTSGTFDLSYKIDGSGAWNTIVSGYDASKRVYEWVAPIVSGINGIKFRVDKGSLSDESNVNTIGSVPQNLSVELASGGDVHLYWDAVNNATAYKIYRLGAKYMEEVTSDITFSNASAILNNQSTTEDEYYAVSAITSSYEGQRTMAIQKPIGDIVANPSTFTASAASSTQIDLTWIPNMVNSDVIIAWSATPDFGTPVNGTDYSVDGSIDGGGTVLYKGSNVSFNHTGLTPYTTYYYKIWSVTSSNTYSSGVTYDEITDCGTIYNLPFEEDFTDITTLPSCWKQRDNQGNGENWQFGTTSASTNSPSLTGNYAYVNSYDSDNNLRNTDLITPTLDLTNNSNIILSFNHQSISTNSSTATVSYSIDNGKSWTLLETFSTTSNPSTYTSSVITELQGQSQVKFKWTYTSTAWTFYWAIDDISIFDSSNYWTGTTDNDWFNPENWSSGSIPTATSTAIIPASASIQPQINSSGATCFGITLQSGASLTMNASTDCTLSVAGDWINNGTFSAGNGTVDFIGNSSLQTITGTSTSTFNILKVSKESSNNILEATSQIATNNLQLISGTFKLNNSASSATLDPNSITYRTIGSTKGIWINSGTLETNKTLYSWGGDIKVSGGTFDVNSTIKYANNGDINIEGGQLNAIRIEPYTTGSSINFIQSGGIVTVATSTSTSTTLAPFDLTPASSFTVSDGIICIERASSFTSDYNNLAATSNVTGGTLQIGDENTTGSPNIRISSIAPMYNLEVNGTGTPTATILSDFDINNNTTIDDGASLIIEPTKVLTVNGVLTNNSGPDGLIIKSSASETGKLLNNTDGVQATIEQYITANTWHYIGIPITETPNAVDVLSGLYVAKNIEENALSGSSSGWSYLTSSNTISCNEGYGIYQVTEDTTISISGTLNANDVVINTTWAGADYGWNLIGNPFPCTVDWDQTKNDGLINVGNAIYVYNAPTQTYAVYNGITSGAGTQDNNIAPMQGFFVRGNSASGSVTFKTSDKTYSSSNFKSTNVQSIIRLQVSNSNELFDQAVILINDEATFKFDSNLDAYKLKVESSLTPQLYSIFDSIEYSINAIPSIDQELEIPLEVLINEPGKYTISLTEITNFDSDLPINITNPNNKSEVNLLEEDYSFSVDEKQTVNLNLTFKTQIVSSTFSPNVYTENNTLIIKRLDNKPTAVWIYNMEGKSMKHEKNYSINNTLTEGLLKGIYFVKIQNNQGQICVKKILIK